MAAILSPLNIYKYNQKTKIPLKPKIGYTPTRALWEYVFVAPSDG
jgi:hypothetical protein